MHTMRDRRSLTTLVVVGALALGACATRPPPAPIVTRTQPKPGMQAPAPVPPVAAPAPGVPLEPPLAQGEAGVETAPIRSGAIERSPTLPPPGASTPGAGPTIDVRPPPQAPAPGATAPIKSGPRGYKRPYSDLALAEMRKAEAGAEPARAEPPAPAAAAPAPEPRSDAKRAPEAGGGDGDFAWPAPGKLLQSFSDTASKGIAIDGRPGESVLAAADGKVIFSGSGPRGYGNLVIVKHDNDLLSVYAHNRSIAVKEGQSVRRGQKIAELGDSGADRPKLHFEIRQQGKPVDPMKFLPRR